MSNEKVVAVGSSNPKHVLSKKTAAVAVNLGLEILKSLVGSTIEKYDLEQNDAELMAAAITTELQL